MDYITGEHYNDTKLLGRIPCHRKFHHCNSTKEQCKGMLVFGGDKAECGYLVNGEAIFLNIE